MTMGWPRSSSTEQIADILYSVNSPQWKHNSLVGEISVVIRSSLTLYKKSTYLCSGISDRAKFRKLPLLACLFFHVPSINTISEIDLWVSDLTRETKFGESYDGLIYLPNNNKYNRHC